MNTIIACNFLTLDTGGRWEGVTSLRCLLISEEESGSSFDLFLTCSLGASFPPRGILLDYAGLQWISLSHRFSFVLAADSR